MKWAPWRPVKLLVKLGAIVGALWAIAWQYRPIGEQ